MNLNYSLHSDQKHFYDVLVQSWIITLVLLSLVLFLIEIFFVPGLGFAGILAFVVLCTATYLTSTSLGTTAAALVFFGVLLLVALSFFAFLRSPLSGLLVLKDQSSKSSGLESPLKSGLSGVCTTALHPSGKARFVSGEKEFVVDVVTSGEFLDNEVPIEIIRVDGSHILVRART